MDETTLKEKITNACARTLWLMAYADFVESDEATKHTPNFPHPRFGQDWDDFAPDTPIEALDFAKRVIFRIEKMNNDLPIANAYHIAADKAMRPGAKRYDDPTPERFGHCLAMESLGTGISWSDDFPNHDLKTPYIEVSAYAEYDNEDEHGEPKVLFEHFNDYYDKHWGYKEEL